MTLLPRAVRGAILLSGHNVAELFFQTARLLYTLIAAHCVGVCPDLICMGCTLGRSSHGHRFTVHILTRPALLPFWKGAREQDGEADGGTISVPPRTVWTFLLSV